MHREPDFHAKLVFWVCLKAIRAPCLLLSPDHQSFVFRLTRDWASPTPGRVPKALQIIYRIIRPIVLRTSTER
jgi:hypothetical protein